MQKFHIISRSILDKIGQTWVDVLTADDLYNSTSLNLALLTFEDDYHLW